MTGYRLREVLLGMIGVALLGTFLAMRSCGQSASLRAQRMDLEALGATARLAYADGDPAAASADPRERLSAFEVAPGASPGGPARLLVNLNAAGVAELARLDGIGEVRAADIVAARERMGGFSSLEDLLEVPGIGAQTLAKMAPSVSLGPAAASAAPTGAEYPTVAGETPRPGPPVSLRAGAPHPPAAAVPTPAPSAAPSSSPTPLPRHTPPPGGYDFGERVPPVNINTASVEELCRLSGIGEAKAADIVAYRKAHGPFLYPSDITKVKGIGSKTYQKNSHLIVVK